MLVHIATNSLLQVYFLVSGILPGAFNIADTTLSIPAWCSSPSIKFESGMHSRDDLRKIRFIVGSNIPMANKEIDQDCISRLESVEDTWSNSQHTYGAVGFEQSLLHLRDDHVERQ